MENQKMISKLREARETLEKELENIDIKSDKHFFLAGRIQGISESIQILKS